MLSLLNLLRLVQFPLVLGAANGAENINRFVVSEKPLLQACRTHKSDISITALRALCPYGVFCRGPFSLGSDHSKAMLSFVVWTGSNAHIIIGHKPIGGRTDAVFLTSTGQPP